MLEFEYTVNVDDAMDDFVRQFKGVSDGLMRKVVGSNSLPIEAMSSNNGGNLSWSAEDISKHISRQDTGETANSFSDNDEGDNDGSRHPEEARSRVHANGWHSDNELSSKGYRPRVIKKPMKLGSDDKDESMTKSDIGQGFPAMRFPLTSDNLVDPNGMPPEVF